MTTANEVAAYLAAHPKFFVKHPKLRAAFALDTPTADAPASAPSDSPPQKTAAPHKRIHERQMQALRERQDRQQAQLDSLLTTARDNQDLAYTLHRFALELLGAADEQTPSVAVEMQVKAMFNLDDVAVFYGASDNAQVDYAQLCQRVAHRGSICDDRVGSKLAKALFPSAKVRACAFVPLMHCDEFKGVMVLGSPSRERFSPQLGVLMLDRLGELAGAYLAGRGAAAKQQAA